MLTHSNGMPSMNDHLLYSAIVNLSLNSSVALQLHMDCVKLECYHGNGNITSHGVLCETGVLSWELNYNFTWIV